MADMSKYPSTHARSGTISRLELTSSTARGVYDTLRAGELDGPKRTAVAFAAIPTPHAPTIDAGLERDVKPLRDVPKRKPVARTKPL